MIFQGSREVEFEPGRGKIPVVRRRKGLGSAIGSGIAHNFAMTRVLLVEDSSDILYVMQMELEWLGYTVYVAANAQTGIEIARLSHPDVIVSDLGLPEEDGFEFIKRIRKTKELAAVPAIALTGFGEPRDVQQALSLGFTAHLTKPVEGNELADLIEKLTTSRLERKAA